MARIIETSDSKRRIIRLSSADVMSVVREYQNNVHRKAGYAEIRDSLSDIVVYVPEDV